jgi:hypothetical protein
LSIEGIAMNQTESFVEHLAKVKTQLASVADPAFVNTIAGYPDFVKVKDAIAKVLIEESSFSPQELAEFVDHAAKLYLTRRAMAILGIRALVKDKGIPKTVLMQLEMQVAERANEVELDHSWKFELKNNFLLDKSCIVKLEFDEKNKTVLLGQEVLPDVLRDLIGLLFGSSRTLVDKPTLH